MQIMGRAMGGAPPTLLRVPSFQVQAEDECGDAGGPRDGPRDWIRGPKVAGRTRPSSWIPGAWEQGQLLTEWNGKIRGP
jgi:hypothetical protein